MKSWERYQRNEVLTSHPVTAISEGIRKCIDDLKAAIGHFEKLEFRIATEKLEKAEGMLYVLIVALFPAAEKDEDISRILRIIDVSSDDVKMVKSSHNKDVLIEVTERLETIYTLFKESEKQWKQ